MSEFPEQAAPPKKKWAVQLLLVLIVFAAILPFTSRAVYMDEHIFLLLARSAQTNWLFPSDTPALFFGRRAANFASHTHPPIGTYYLAGVYAILGEFREVPFRILYSLFPLMAVAGFYGLACRFTQIPVTATLLLAFSPAFFATSHTLMMDMPMLAFLLVGLTLYFKSVDGRSGNLVPASLCFILAVGAGYTALVPVSCLFVWAVFTRRPKQELWAIAAIPLALFAWLAMMTVHFGYFPLTDTVMLFVSQAQSPFRNTLATLSFVGGVSVFPWSFLLLADTKKKGWLVVAGLVIVTCLTLFLEWPSFPYRLWFLFLASNGLVMLVVFTASWFRRLREETVPGHGFLVLWTWAVLIFFVVVADMINARYILMALPALYLVLFRKGAWPSVGLAIIPTLLVSVTIATADYRFVNSYRTWVKSVVVPLQEQGFKVWGAAESGLRFYLEQRNIETLGSHDLRPRGGDLIIRPARLFRYSLSSDLEPLLVHLNTQDLTDSFPIRTYNLSAGAGFHDSHIGLVPFNLSTAPHDRLEIVQLSPLVGRLPQTVPANFESVAVWSPSGVMLKQVEPVQKFSLRIPKNTEIQYELEGDGSIEVTSDFIKLSKGNSDSIVWRNLRIMPKGFLIERQSQPRATSQGIR
ncbi:hypothetical protein MYX82_13685 [Acidobacteria bacterium AH-259-D05]|nr:hypothetical protein [Acidobacteria bacterium AH-259-D05]